MRTRALRLATLAGAAAIGVLFHSAPVFGIDDATFQALLDDLDSRNFVRWNGAQEQLLSQALLALQDNTKGLTPAQLGTIRRLATDGTVPGIIEGDLQCRRSAERIMHQFGKLVDDVNAGMRAHMSLTKNVANAVGDNQITTWRFDTMPSMTVGKDVGDVQKKALEKFEALQRDVEKAIASGDANGITDKLNALKNLPKDDWDATGFPSTYEKFQQRVDLALTRAPILINDILQKTANTNPGLRKLLPVPKDKQGALHPAMPFNITVTSATSGGDLDVFAPAPGEEALAAVDGYAFVGQVYELVAEGGLAFSGPITIEMLFSSDPSFERPVFSFVDPSELVIARYANNELQFLDDLEVVMSPDGNIIRGEYLPPSEGLGLNQLGTFVILQVPTPGAMTTFGALGLAALRRRR